MPEPLGPYYASSLQPDRKLAAAVDRRLRGALGPKVAAMLPGYEPFLGSIIAKEARTSGEVGFHQDWTFTDETRQRAVMCWVPLVDTDDRTGAMRVVSGSHRWSDGARPSGCAQATDALQRELAARSQTVPMRRGDGLVYDPALVHGSWPHRGPEDRIAVAVASAPVGVQLVHDHDDGSGVVRRYRVERAFFTERPYGSTPDVESPPFPVAVATSAELAAGLARR